MVPTGGGGLLRAVSLLVVSASAGGCWAVAQKQEKIMVKQNINFMPFLFKCQLSNSWGGVAKNKARCKNNGLVFMTAL
jgi:hypothetical protein